MTKRLIEEWLPIAELGEESMRERRSMTALPPNNYLHVWWARRPLVASRAAVLASLLPAGADRRKFMQIAGIHGDPVAAKKRITKATRDGVRLGPDAYGYNRAFSYSPSSQERLWLLDQARHLGIAQPAVLDPTAGGGAIPFESLRLGCSTYSNDINPVASLVQKATFEWPAKYGVSLADDVKRLGGELAIRLRERLSWAFPSEPMEDCISDGYLWARTICCPYCSGTIPLSPYWKLNAGGLGIRIIPHLGEGPGDPSRVCSFEVVDKLSLQSLGTVKGGDATCPFEDCGRIVDGAQVKAQAQAGEMGEQLFAVVLKRKLPTQYTSNGKAKKAKWERCYRSPLPEDDNSAAIQEFLREKLPEWEALDIAPNETLPMDTESWTHGNTPAQYGATTFLDLFSPRQLLCHLFSVLITHKPPRP